jgi:hypothetical protein
MYFMLPYEQLFSMVVFWVVTPCATVCSSEGHSSCQFLTVKAWVHNQGSPCAIYGGKSDNETDFPPGPSVYPCQYHYTNAPYSLMYQFHRDTVSPHHNNNKEIFIQNVDIYLQVHMALQPRRPTSTSSPP